MRRVQQTPYLGCYGRATSTGMPVKNAWRMREPWPCMVIDHVPRRYTKTRSTVNAIDLPQGHIVQASAKNSIIRFEEPSFPVVIQQARNNMRKFENCVLLTRVGGFYELYFEQAESYGPQLNLKVGYKRTIAGRVAMAGFPFFQLDRFLKILVQDYQLSVAISEEFPNSLSDRAKSGGLLFDRRVARVVTPGTLVDEKFIDPYSNNFLVALSFQTQNSDSGKSSQQKLTGDTDAMSIADQTVGLAWLDVSTGEFFTQQSAFAEIPSSLVRIGARELVLDVALKEFEKQTLLRSIREIGITVTWQPIPEASASISEWEEMLEGPMDESRAAEFSSAETNAGSMLLRYVRDRLQATGIRLQQPSRVMKSEHMTIDKNTLKGLELLETSRDSIVGGKGSLLHTIQRTTTKSGYRLLRQRLGSPSASLVTIHQRLNLVEEFLRSPLLRARVTESLERTVDSQRIVQKFAMGRGDADDLLDLRRTILGTQSIMNLLKDAQSSLARPSPNRYSPSPFEEYIDRVSLKSPTDLARRIAATIDEESLATRHREEELDRATVSAMVRRDLKTDSLDAQPDNLHSLTAPARTSDQSSSENGSTEQNPWTMKRTASTTLSQLHETLNRLDLDKTNLESSMRRDLGTNSLTLRWTPALGHICHVKGSKDLKSSHEKMLSAKNASTSKSTRSFYLPEWSSLGTSIDKTKARITAEEARIFQLLREDVVVNVSALRRNASVLDELDVACSSAIFAAEQDLVRPLVNNSTTHRIVGGRHPSVKIGLEEKGRSFVGNDCFVGESQHVWLITGPNMAGKSTYLRQNAIISVLAQIGSFVPAEFAEIGLVDQIFSRIGSADNLYQDQSTFMVEMLETASILKLATSRSLVVMDEVGRGTAPEDGIAVSFACLHHLYHTNKSRTLFATHFHKLADMTESWPGLGRYCNDIETNTDGSFLFVHRLRPGVNRESHALKVAKLAGLPPTAIDVAATALKNKWQDHRIVQHP